VPQMPVLRLVNLNKIHVESEVTETYLKSIKKGTEVELNFPSLGKTITSKVTQVGNFINPNNRSFKVRIDLNNANNDIKANLLADVKIKDFQANGIVLPTTILQKDRLGKTFVFTLKKEGEVYTTQKNICECTNVLQQSIVYLAGLSKKYACGRQRITTYKSR